MPSNLKNLKSKVDKFNVDKIVSVPVDSISKLSDVVKMTLLKKMYIMLKYWSRAIEDKILDITILATTTTLNVKINDGKNKIPNITSITIIPNITNIT